MIAPLVDIVQNDDADALRAALRNGADPNTTVGPGRGCGDAGPLETVLMRAVRWNRAGCWTALLEAGADVNRRDSFGGTALMHAVVTAADPTCVAALLAAGADPAAQDQRGRHALLGAGGVTGTQMMTALIAAGAPVNVCDAAGISPLMRAVEHNNTRGAALLLAAGADPDAAAPDGKTSLMLAAQNGWRAMLMVLLEAGADPNPTTATGQRADDFARHGDLRALLQAARSERDRAALRSAAAGAAARPSDSRTARKM